MTNVQYNSLSQIDKDGILQDCDNESWEYVCDHHDGASDEEKEDISTEMTQSDLPNYIKSLDWREYALDTDTNMV